MSNLTYDTDYNKRIVDVIKKYQKIQNKMHPGPEYFLTTDSYHRMIGGGRVQPGFNGSYQPAELDEMSVRGYHLLDEIRHPIGLPKPVGVGKSGGAKSGGKTKLTKQIEELGEYAKPVTKPILDALTKKIVRKIGKGRSGGRMSGGEMSAGAKSGGRMSGGKTERGKLVAKLMKEKKLTLPEASRYIKENGLMK